MTQATKFYLPFFKTGVPNGKLFTYLSGTNTISPVYKEDGTEHSIPVYLDEKGEATIYINSDLTYRYVLYDENNNLVSDNSNIRQLNGEPGTPGGPRGPTGFQGRQGNQGISGNQGPIGQTGPKGDKGLPYLTEHIVTNDLEFVIPQGVEEIYITGTGGGGSAASWSPFSYVYRTANTVLPPFSVNPPYKNVSTGTTGTAQQGQLYTRGNYSTLIFIPGSGFAGQSVYRRRVALDKNKENRIQVFPGVGGAQSTTNINGNAGTNTKIYLNSELILDLKGGEGGKNFFPQSETTLPIIPTDGTPIRLNNGASNGLIYFQNGNTESFSTPVEGQILYAWTTTYKQRSGSTYVNKEIQLSYYAPIISMSSESISFNSYTLTDIKDVAGNSSIFGRYYQTYQDKANLLSPPANPTTSTKIGFMEKGWGSGGDVYYNPNNSQYDVPYNLFSGMINRYVGSRSQVYIFDKDYVKSSIRNYMTLFNVSDSYTPGVATLPGDDDAFWVGVDNVDTLIQNNPNVVYFKGAGFYNSIRSPAMAGVATARGGAGVNGFVKIEYGIIKENS